MTKAVEAEIECLKLRGRCTGRPDEGMILLIRPDCSDHLPSPVLLEEPAVELIVLPSSFTGDSDGSLVKRIPCNA